MFKHISKYWWCQILGWMAYFVINVFFAYSFGKIAFPYLLNITILILFGLLSTHLLRNVINRQNWFQYSFEKQALLFFALMVGTGIIIYVGPTITSNFFRPPEQRKPLSGQEVLWGLLSNFLITAIWWLIYFVWHYIDRNRNAEVDKLKLESTVKELELKTIKSQLNPHFIFNALNSIRALVDENPQRARTAITELSNIEGGWIMALKKLIVALSLLAATTLSARAADLAPQPVEPAAPVEMPFTWTGFYVGVNAGYGVGSTSLDGSSPLLPPLPLGIAPHVGDWSSNGALGGGQIGYNYQINSFVVGAELDGDFSGISGKLNLLNVLGIKTENEWLASARLRVGYAFDRALFYATGGVAGGGVKNSINVLGFGVTSQDKTSWGWTAGLGLEYAITDNWSARLEYRHVDLGDNSQNYAIFGAPFKLKFKNNFDIGTVGVNYRF